MQAWGQGLLKKLFTRDKKKMQITNMPLFVEPLNKKNFRITFINAIVESNSFVWAMTAFTFKRLLQLKNKHKIKSSM